MSTRRKILSLAGVVVILAIPSLFLIGTSYVLGDVDFPRKLTAWAKGAEYLGTEGVILQDKRNNCGPAALKMVFDHFAIPSGLVEIENQAALTDRGTSMLGLKEVSELMGLRAEGWRYTVEDFTAAPMPAIVFVHGDHFAVVDTITENGSIIMRDPVLGKLTISKEKFAKIWAGETLIFGNQPGRRSE